MIAEAKKRTDWAIGFQDEVWWSRLTHPNMHSWAVEKSLKLVEQSKGKDDPDPKAFACYGLDMHWKEKQEIWMRFVEGNPKSDPTIQFLTWVLEKTEQEGISVLVMFWDHASWHKSKTVRSWIRKHNQHAKLTGEGTRLLACLLPKKSPWLNPIEPRWIHAKRKVVSPDKKLKAQELAERICAVFKQAMLPWLVSRGNVS